jgi:hypothetical protein
MDFLYVIATIYAVLNGIKLIILVIGFCLQNKFNKNIIYGQIPQYNVVNSEYENNVNDINIYDKNTLNNRNDNLKNNKNENYNSIGQNIYNKKDVYENKNVFKNIEKEHSSELDINSLNKKNKLDLEKSFERNNYIEKSQKSNKDKVRNNPIFKYEDLQSIKKTLTEDFKIKNLYYKLNKENKEENPYENNINENDSHFYINNTNTNMDINTNIDININNNENIINNDINNDNNDDVEGIIYPFDSIAGIPNINDENNINEINNE